MFFRNFLFFNSIADIANKNIPCKFAINNESFQKKKKICKVQIFLHQEHLRMTIAMIITINFVKF